MLLLQDLNDLYRFLNLGSLELQVCLSHCELGLHEAVLSVQLVHVLQYLLGIELLDPFLD